jgi:hypothetical protein
MRNSPPICAVIRDGKQFQEMKNYRFGVFTCIFAAYHDRLSSIFTAYNRLKSAERSVCYHGVLFNSVCPYVK